MSTSLVSNTETAVEQLDAILVAAERLERHFSDDLAAVHPDYLESARNLVHYVALRHVDIRDLQQQLTELGLSSLSTAEPHVMATLKAVRHALNAMRGDADKDEDVDAESFVHSRNRLEKHSDDLFGTNPNERNVEIMVTLPTEAAENYRLVHEFVATGMDVARINCAHDTEADRLGMVKNVRRAAEETGRQCRIVMDLAGPKVRTGPLLPGPGVLRIRPQRDGLGRVISPKRLRFYSEEVPWRGKRLTVVPVPQALIDFAEAGDVIKFRDARGRKRQLRAIRKDKKGLVLEAHKPAYLATGTKLTLVRKDSREKHIFETGQLPPIEIPIILMIGDLLLLHKSRKPGEPAVIGDDEASSKPAHISCIPPEILDRVSVGAAVLLNDGKIEGIVEETTDVGLLVRITNAKATGSRLRGNRSINFPGTDLELRGLTDSDRANLEFVVEHADSIGLSFVRSPEDVIALQTEISKRTDRQIGIIPKIETEEAFHVLPLVLLAAMRSYPAGIMIARGDLAVECGWERLAEIQEEILWMCEAAHIPVIWATQVLEGKAKKGRPSRAEITDAAMSQRADCVMLNKGIHVLSAIRMLDNILCRMQDHQHKKAPILRKLSITDL